MVRFPSAVPASVAICLLAPLELLVIGGSVPHHGALLVCVIEVRRNSLDFDGLVETNSGRDFWKVGCAAHCDGCIGVDSCSCACSYGCSCIDHKLWAIALNTWAIVLLVVLAGGICFLSVLAVQTSIVLLSRW